MTLRAAGQAVMGRHFERMTLHEAGTVAGSDPEALHDMRVATRRLRAACRVFRAAFGPEALAPHLAEIRWLAALLGQVRDLDVFLAWLRGVEADAPEPLRAAVTEMVAAYDAQRHNERIELVAALSSPRYARFKEGFARFLQADGWADPHAEGDAAAVLVTAAARRAVQREWRRVLRLARQTDDDDLDGLHQVRIACKRLRYTAEFFADLYPDGLKNLIGVCVEIQDALGDMHDAYVHEQALRQQWPLHEAALAARMALHRMARALRRKQAASYDLFRQRYPTLTSRKFQRQIKKRLRKPIESP